jgi:hypothetical protein
VEGEIGRFRRRHLVPVPGVASLAALNQLIAAGDLVDDGQVITGRPVTIAAAFAAEQPELLPLPAGPFDPARLLQARVDGRARVCVRQNYYSVPARYAGRRTLIEVLLAHRALPSGAPQAAMATAISCGILDPHVVLIDARRAAGGQAAAVIAIGALARYDRPAPTLTACGQLLSRSTP